LTIIDVIRERGPITVAAFMDVALYDDRFGYYARAPQRSGRAGDFFTSVDVGPVFGSLLAIEIGELADILSRRVPSDTDRSPGRFDLVEAGAGNGRLSADILRALRHRDPDLFDRLRLHLVESSPEARGAQPAVLGELSQRLVESSDSLPESVEGVVIANELLDALPVHQVVMRKEGLREVYVLAVADKQARGSTLIAVEGPPSTPRLAEYLAQIGVVLEPGWRAEIGLRAVEWIRHAARTLRRGFLILIDYGHEARELYSVTHSSGTLRGFSGHTVTATDAGGQGGAGFSGTPPWLARPGDQDLTAHVDFTSVRAAAEAEGLTTLCFTDQTYFLLGLLGGDESAAFTLNERLALKTLMIPGGLGSTHKVLILGKNVGEPALLGCSFRQRIT
jgi:SAM-dependent MidA family methyltransferase